MKIEELKSLLQEIKNNVEQIPDTISNVSTEKNAEIQEALYRLERSLGSVIRIQG
jgi:hypothetical protein